MSNYKNPYVELERLPYSIIERFVTYSSMKEKPKEKNAKRTKFEKPEEKKKKRPTFANRNVKASRLKDISEDESSMTTDDSTDDSDYSEADSNDSDYKPKEKNAKRTKFEKPEEKREMRSTSANRNVKKSRLKYISEDESSDTDESNCSEADSNDSDYKPEKKKGKKQKMVIELTEYEKLVQKNKDDKMAFLESLKINEVKENFSEAVKGFSLKFKKKDKKKHTSRPKPPSPRLKLYRSSKVKIDLSEEAFVDRDNSKVKEVLKKEIKILPKRLCLKDVLHSDQSYKLFCEDFKGLDQGCTEPIDNYESRFNDMELLTSHVKTFKPTMMTALDIHPMREKTIIAGGALNGHLYIWNMTDPEPYAFDLHSYRFKHLKFIPENPHLIMCCNSDGLLRKGNLVSNVYNEVTNSNDCTYFDFLSPETCLVAHRSGYVTVVDMRAPPRKKKYGQISHQCHDSLLRTVSIHPLNKKEFITPTKNGYVQLWDLRQLKKQPVMEVCHSHTNAALHSAIYSPLTGKSVLTSSICGNICRSDVSKWGVLTLKMFRRKLPISYVISATWQPRTDDVFAVASKPNTRSIDIYNRSNRLFNYSHESIKGYIYFCAFHPSLPIFAAITHGGVFPFADKKLQLKVKTNSSKDDSEVENYYSENDGNKEEVNCSKDSDSEVIPYFKVTKVSQTAKQKIQNKCEKKKEQARRSRERIRNDPELHELAKEKNRQRYLARKKKVKESLSEAVNDFSEAAVTPEQIEKPNSFKIFEPEQVVATWGVIETETDAAPDTVGYTPLAIRRLGLKKIPVLRPKPQIVPHPKLSCSPKVKIDLSTKTDTAEEALQKKSVSFKKDVSLEMEESEIVPDLPESVHLKDILHSDQSYRSFLKDFKGLDRGCTKPIDKYESHFDNMELLTSHVKSFYPILITALDIHPMQEKTIIAGGAANGNIYLWNMVDLEPYAFELHSNHISCLKFNPVNPHLIMCCSRNGKTKDDGVLMEGDLVANVYNKVTDSKTCACFDYLGPDTCLVGHLDGTVTVADKRAPLKKNEYGQISHKCHESMLRSVSVHPLDKNEFITPTNKGCVRLWDLRKLQKDPVKEVRHTDNDKNLCSAVYSPLTGKSVLTASVDGKICMSDRSNWGWPRVKCMFKIKRPASPLMPIYATWQPRTDNIFAVGNKNKLNPGGIDIYNPRNNTIFNHSHECINGAISFCTFHPSLPIIAAVRIHKVYFFADKNLQIAQ